MEPCCPRSPTITGIIVAVLRGECVSPSLQRCDAGLHLVQRDSRVHRLALESRKVAQYRVHDCRASVDRLSAAELAMVIPATGCSKAGQMLDLQKTPAGRAIARLMPEAATMHCSSGYHDGFTPIKEHDARLKVYVRCSAGIWTIAEKKADNAL